MENTDLVERVEHIEFQLSKIKEFIKNYEELINSKKIITTKENIFLEEIEKIIEFLKENKNY